MEKIAVAAHTEPIGNDRFLQLGPVEQETLNVLSTVICDTRQVQTILEPTTFDTCPPTLVVELARHTSGI